MAEPLGLQVQIPQFDLGATLGRVAQIRAQEAALQHSQTANALASTQLAEAQQRQGALQAFRADPNHDPSLLAGNPDLYTDVLKSQETRRAIGNERAAQAAVDVLSASPGAVVGTYQQKLEELRKQGDIPALTHQQLSQVTDPDQIRTIARGFIARNKPEALLPHPGQVGSTLGLPEFGIYDPITQTIRQPSPTMPSAGPAGSGGSPGTPGTGAALPPAELARSGLKGQALLDELARSVNPGFANEIKAIGDYDQPFPPPGSRGQMDPWIKMFVRQYRPDYDQTGYAAKQKVMTGMSSGSEAEQIKSFNTVPMHLAGLYDAVTKLKNFSYLPSVTNRVGNAVGGQFSKGTQDAMGEFDSAKKAVAGEMAKVFRASGMSVAEIDDWKESFDRNSSPEYMYAAIRKAVELIEGRMGAVANQWRTTPGLQDKPFDKISRSAQAVFDVLRDARGPLDKRQEALLQQAAEETRRSLTAQPGGRAKPGEKVDHGPLPQTQVAPPPGAVNLLRQVQAGAKSVTLPSGKVLSAQEYIDAFNDKYGAPK